MMFNLDETTALVTELSLATSIESVSQILVRLTALFDYDYFLLGWSVPFSITRSDPFILDNYPDLWREKYDRQDFINIDPVVKHCLQNSAAITWADLQKNKLSLSEKSFFSEAKKSGLIGGYTVPIRGNRGEAGLLSFASGKKESKFSESEQLTIYTWAQAIAPVAFSTVSNLIGTEQQADVALTKREKESLLWAAEGKTTWEISQILDCSERTVFFHLNNATKKLDAANRYQAISKAILLGYIKPDLKSGNTTLIKD